MEVLFDKFIEMTLFTKTFQAKKIAINKRTGKPIIYTDKDFTKIKSYISMTLSNALRSYIDKPINKPMRLDVVFVFEANKLHKSGEPHVKKPDRDNLLKTIQDILEVKTKNNKFGIGLIKNDSHIYDGRLTKVYGDIEGISLKLSI